MDIPDLLIIASSLVCSAFFSGMEIAFISANKLQIELENKQGYFYARILSFFLKRPSRFIGTMLVGNNIALVIYGIYMGDLIMGWLDPSHTWNQGLLLAVQTVISTLIILITAEFLPKTVFRINPNRVLNILAVPLVIIYFLLWIPMIITIGLSEWLLKAFLKVDFAENKPVFGRVDLDNYVREMTDRAADQEDLDHEIQIFQNALEFSKVKARDCMIPRTEIVALDVEDTIETLRQKFVDTGLSKILIYRDSIDNIIGYTHSYELFKRPDSIKSILLPVSIIPETIAANEILELFIKKKKSVAIVVDEFGGTAGMLTIEDVVEEIFGEIEDEHDSEALLEDQITNNEFLFSGRIEIDYVNEKYGLNLPESEEYETLAGLILHNYESIPKANSQIIIDQFKFYITEVSDTRIDEVRLTVVKEAV